MARESESVNSIKFVVDKVSFVNKLPLLSRATSDDEHPTPGYMYQQISNLTTDRGSYCSDLLDYLVSRLEKRSYHVKLKVLRIMRYVVDNGHMEFRQNLKRRADGIREATKFGGPPDRLHGNAPYIMVRKEAKELCSILYEMAPADTDMKHSSVTSASTMVGMGTRTGHGTQGAGHTGALQGFGNTGIQQKSLTESLVGGIRDLANKVLDPAPQAVRPDALSSAHRADRKFSDYKPVQFTEESVGLNPEMVATTEPEHRIYHKQQQRIKTRSVQAHVPGVPGGGWADDDDDGTADDQQGAALSGSEPGSEDINHSFSKLSTVTTHDYVAERQLVADSVNKGGLLMKRPDIEDFIKRCSSMNCVQVVENIGDVMVKSTHIFQLHSLQLCEALLRTDLITPDELAAACKSGLDTTYRSQHKQTKVKARKVIRILEKLCYNADIISGVIPAADNDLNNFVTASSSGQSKPAAFQTDQSETGFSSVIQADILTTRINESETTPVLSSHTDQSAQGQQLLSDGEMNEDFYMSNFDFIKPPFADNRVLEQTLSRETYSTDVSPDIAPDVSSTSDTLQHSKDSLCSDENV